MPVELIKATFEYKDVIKNLMQFYIYDFSEYLKIDVEASGNFSAYKHFDDYWIDENRFPYIIKKDENYAGFVFVRLIENESSSSFSVAEFFIMRKYRRERLGSSVAKQIFNLYKGNWEIFQKESNQPAHLFWTKVIDEYTEGNFCERCEEGKFIQNFKNC